MKRTARLLLSRGRPRVAWAEVAADESLRLLCGGPGSACTGKGPGRCRILAPCQPSKIVAVGLNYREHIEEMGHAGVPDEPVIFLKQARPHPGRGSL